jgi:DNA polymerase-1
MLIQTREQFELARTVLLQADLIAVDLETNWDTFPKQNAWDTEWDDKRLMGISTHCEIDEGWEMSYYFPFRHNEFDRGLFKENNENLPYSWLRELAPALEKADCTYIFHNFKGDDHVLRKEGIEVCGTVYDTMIMSWMDNENRFSHALEDVGREIEEKKLGKELKEIAKALKGWNKIPPEVMALYACEDARITYKLFFYFREKLEQQELLELYPREERKIKLLRKMENLGVGVDKEIARRLSVEALKNMQAAQASFGYDPNKPSQLAHRLFSEPPEGLGLPVIGGYSKRKSIEFAPHGIPNMDKNVLSRLGHEECLKVIEYRRWMKANSTWYEGWFYKTASDDRIHPTFKQHGTKTSRVSHSRPNMGQIPRDIEKYPVKKMLKARDGYQLWGFDYSQIEFRIGAIYAGCKPILEAYLGGFDVHKLTSETIGIQELSGLNAEESRYAGKQTNFLTIFGGGVEVLIFQIYRDTKIILPYDTADAILNGPEGFHKKFPEFKRCAYKCENVAKANGFVKLWNGWKRHFDAPWEAYKAFNSICQGGAAQIMWESALMLDEAGYDLINLVHDDIWIEIPTEQVETSVPKIIEMMEWPGEEFGLPFPVEPKRLA